MVQTYVDRIQTIQRSVPGWITLSLRLVLIVLIAKPALSKFITYGDSVSFFDAIGMPAPAVMVLIAGVIEVGAVGLLLVGFGKRLAAISLVPVMLVAILYVGPDWKNLSVLFGSMALVALETDLAVIRESTERLLG